MERFMEVVLPIFILAAMVAFIYHKAYAQKKDGKNFLDRISGGRFGVKPPVDQEK